MIGVVTLLTHAAVVPELFLIPGPAVLLVLARSMSGGRRVGVATGLGIAIDDLIHTIRAVGTIFLALGLRLALRER